MKQKVIIIIFILCITGIVSATIFGQRGIVYLLQLQTELETIQYENTMLSAKNAQLKKQIALLEHNTGFIEKIARDELGLAKEKELIYLVQKPAH